VEVINARRLTRQALPGALLCAVLALAALAMLAPAARAAATDGVRPVRHVVIVGISGLRWTFVSAASTPVLWHLAGEGSVGALVDYAEEPLACPDDGWLTLNGGARAQGPRPCAVLPRVIPSGGGATIPTLPGIIAYNDQFHENPDWGLLRGLAGCATAVGPGAALALAAPSGAVSSYLPSPSDITAGVLARCPLTVVDLGALSYPERSSASAADRQLARIVADLPSGTLLLVTAPGAALGGRPHLRTVVISGQGYADGLLRTTSTRQPGIVTLTDLVPTVAGWLDRGVPATITGARITRGDRGSLASAVRVLDGRDTAEQVWMTTHGWFFAGYTVADVVLLGVPALVFWGSDAGRRRRRAGCWRVAGVFAVAVPVGTFLANVVPWWLQAHPAAWLYGLAVAWTLVIGAFALAGPWRRQPMGPVGVVCLGTLLVLGIDVMTGSRLQLDVPFGLSLLLAGRFYGIGNETLGVYCVCALVAAALLPYARLWGATRRRLPSPPEPGSSVQAAPRPVSSRRLAVLGASAVGLFAVVASGWPGFGAKVGGTIALVPCLALLVMALAGVRVNWRRATLVAVSGLALFIVFAVVSYFIPAVGVSDMGTFAGNLLHGQGGALLERKVSSNIGTLTVSPFSPLIPIAAVLTGFALWRPSALRLLTLEWALVADPLLRVTAWLIWLVLVIGWLADDSGVVVPAAALPFAVPLLVALVASVSCADDRERYRSTAFAGSSVAGTTPR
jgi:hypothetical protein